MASNEHLLQTVAGLQVVSEALEEMIAASMQDGHPVVAALIGGLHNQAHYIMESASAAAQALAKQKPERHPLDIWKDERN